MEGFLQEVMPGEAELHIDRVLLVVKYTRYGSRKSFPNMILTHVTAGRGEGPGWGS